MPMQTVRGRAARVGPPLFFSSWPERIPGRDGPHDKPEDAKKMADPLQQSVGIDTAKERLDVRLHPSGDTGTVPHHGPGHRSLIA